MSPFMQSSPVVSVSRVTDVEWAARVRTRFDGLQGRSPTWAHVARTLARRGLSPMHLGAATCALVLLASFVQVVRGGVQRADERRQVLAAREQAILRCNALPGVAARSQCLAQASSSDAVGSKLASSSSRTATSPVAIAVLSQSGN